MTSDVEYDAVLIYDGDCPFCSATSSALRRVRGVGTISWHDDAAQAFLEAQFDDIPFALVLVDYADELVYAGRDAATELCERAGLPVLVRDVVGGNYESFADAVQSVADVDRDVDPYHDTYPLASVARDTYPRLAEAAGSMPLAAGVD